MTTINSTGRGHSGNIHQCHCEVHLPMLFKDMNFLKPFQTVVFERPLQIGNKNRKSNDFF